MTPRAIVPTLRAVGVILRGVEARVVEVEAEVGDRRIRPTDRLVREGLVRVGSALRTLGTEGVQVSLPVGVAWEPPLDLAVTAAVVGGDHDTAYLGEVSLAGRVLAVRGILPRADAAIAVGCRRIVVPRLHQEIVAHYHPRVEVCGIESVADLLDLDGCRYRPATEADPKEERWGTLPDYLLPARVRVPREGDVLLIGHPGFSITQIAYDLRDLRPMDARTVHEVDVAYSLALVATAPSASRPLRAPHYTVSPAGLATGGAPGRERPAEAHLAHGGVLVLDDLPNYDRCAIRSLSAVRRGAAGAKLPASFRLVTTTADDPRSRKRALEYARILGITQIVEV